MESRASDCLIEPRREVDGLLSPLRGWVFVDDAYPQLLRWALCCRRSAADRGRWMVTLGGRHRDGIAAASNAVREGAEPTTDPDRFAER